MPVLVHLRDLALTHPDDSARTFRVDAEVEVHDDETAFVRVSRIEDGEGERWTERGLLVTARLRERLHDELWSRAQQAINEERQRPVRWEESAHV